MDEDKEDSLMKAPSSPSKTLVEVEDGRIVVPTDKEETFERDQWSTKIDFVLSVVGLCVGLGNVWRFPYLCYENGGGVFLIPYLLTLFLGGIPILFMELSVGQMLKIGGLGVWKVCPLFKGVGYAAAIMAFWLSIYYIVILAYAIYYLANTFTLSGLPWSSCSGYWSTPCCRSEYNTNVTFSCVMTNISISNTNITEVRIPNLINSTEMISFENLMEKFPNETQLCSICSKFTTPVTEFWERNVLEETKGIHDVGTIRWPLAAALLLAWVICYFCIWKGVKWTGKVVYFTALFPYFLLVCFFIRGVTLPGSAMGITFYLKPNITKLQESKVWSDAASQIFFSYGLGLGTHIAMGSYNPTKNNCHRDALVVACVNSGTSFFAGFVIFSIIGHMAKLQNKLVSDVATSGQGLAFLVYPSAISQLPYSPIWAGMFFFMILIIGLDSQFCTLEGLITAIIDEWPKVFRKRREWLLLFVCVISYIIGISTVTQGGPYVFRIFDHYSASGIALLLLIMCECVAFSWCFGSTRLCQKIEGMIGYPLRSWWKACWVVFCPLVCFSVFLFSVLKYENVKYKNYDFPKWAHMIGWMISLSSILAIPLYWIYYITLHVIMNKEGTFKERLMNVLRPNVAMSTDEPVENNIPIDLLTAVTPP